MHMHTSRYDRMRVLVEQHRPAHQHVDQCRQDMQARCRPPSDQSDPGHAGLDTAPGADVDPMLAPPYQRQAQGLASSSRRNNPLICRRPDHGRDWNGKYRVQCWLQQRSMTMGLR